MKLGKYEIIEELGRGGFGIVYKVRDTVLDVERALKVLHPHLLTDVRSIERFRQEARVAAKLDHPNIVPVYDFDEVDGRIFLVMKYIPGGSLKDILESKSQLDEENTIKIFEQVCSALMYLHSQGIVHRDLKPSNILINEDGSIGVSDMGFAKAIADSSSTSLSVSGAMVGTPSYMAPEIWRGKPATPAGDQYSLACILYEMLTGKVLFDGESPAEVMIKHVSKTPRLNERFKNPIFYILNKSLSIDPENRFNNVMEMERALKYEKLEMTSNILPTDHTGPRTLDNEINVYQQSDRIKGDNVNSSVGKENEIIVPKNQTKNKLLLGGVGIVALIFIPIIIFSLKGGKGNQKNLSQTPIAEATTSTPIQSIKQEQLSSDKPLPTFTISPTETKNVPLVTEELPEVFIQVRETDDMEIAFIPAGSFLMGLNDNQIEKLLELCSNCEVSDFDYVKPQHEVYLDDYWIDRYEVSNEQFAKFLNEVGNQLAFGIPWYNEDYEESKIIKEGDIWSPLKGYEDYPVGFVSWFGAEAYCNWANESTLPTEAQWEKAARGIDARIFPWGDDIGNCNHANKKGCGGELVPVGTHPSGASPYGVEDLAGNVDEWVADRFDNDYYTSQSEWKNPTGPTKGEFMIRGSNLYNDEIYSCVSIRVQEIPNYQDMITGFRCVKNFNPISINNIAEIPDENDFKNTPASFSEVSSVNSVDNSEIIKIPEGEFSMGYSSDDINYIISQVWCNDCNVYHFQSAIPQHQVYLDSFWINKYEITNGQFSKFVNQTNYLTDAEKNGGSMLFLSDPSFGIVREYQKGAFWGAPKGPNSENEVFQDHPVVHVSWNDAIAYCEWAGGRLPSEAEWEKAARGSDQRLFPWGNEPPNSSLANFRYLIGTTTAVGRYPLGRSPYGVMDMAGNVWEWVLDVFDDRYYYSSPDKNPVSKNGYAIVQRGGSWANKPISLLSTQRWGEYEADGADLLTGIRCVFDNP